MNPISLQQVAMWCAGELRGPAQAGEAMVNSVSTDSRTLAPGQLFVALRGERFDGHDFVEKAAAAGCVGAVVECGAVDSDVSLDLALIEVADTLLALQALAAGYRGGLTAPVVGVTGSSGKTSTKELLRAAMSPLGRVQATRGNLNNHIGLPLTVLEGDDVDAAHVWEMGMNHPGEIAPLASIAAPNAGVITMIGTAHIEHMGSREAIAREKGELLLALPESGLAVLPADDDFYELLKELAPCRVVSAGFSQRADYRVCDYRAHADGSSFVVESARGAWSVRIAAPGRHMAANCALAMALSRELTAVDGNDMTGALADAKLTGGRLSLIDLNAGVQVLDDSYNANPESARAALRTLAEMPATGERVQRRVAVLGRMGELGQFEQPAYLQLADTAAELGVDVLHVVGEAWVQALETSRHPFALYRHASMEALLEQLVGLTCSGDLILVKGSRGARMERAVDLLQREFAD